jgi:hypothetical protein
MQQAEYFWRMLDGRKAETRWKGNSMRWRVSSAPVIWVAFGVIDGSWKP